MIALKLFSVAMLVITVLAEMKKPAEILSEQTFVRQDGYNFEYKTSDGVSRNEEAKLLTIGDHQGIGIKGTYSYIAPDGLQYVVTYTADENGFKPQLRVLPATQ